nr:glutamine synthetase [Streptomyces albospinus]
MRRSLRNKKQEWEEYPSEATASELRTMPPVR